MKKLVSKGIFIFLVFLLVLESIVVAPVTYGQSSPDLEILIGALEISPVSPPIGEPVTVRVQVGNNGPGQSPESKVSLEWDCGEISRTLPALDVGEMGQVAFPMALIFNVPGTYQVTITVDKANLIAEVNETNNAVIRTIRVNLREEEEPPWLDPGWEWDDEFAGYGISCRGTDGPCCPLSDLMKIGKRPQSVFAVGDGGEILIYGGLARRNTESGVTENLQSVWCLCAGEIFRVYAAGEGGTILEYDGTSWNPMVSNTNADLADIWGDVAVGKGGTILDFDGTSWNTMVSNTSADLEGIWGDVAVGGGGTILRFDGALWNPMVSNTNTDLKGIWGSHEDDVFAVGEGGTILHYDGNAARTWNTMTSGTGIDLEDIWGSTSVDPVTGLANDVFATGEGGTILRFDGALWTPMVSNTNADLKGIWGSSEDDVFAVGEQGTIIHYDGNAAGTWSSRTSDTTATLWAIRGWAPYSCFLPGQAGPSCGSTSLAYILRYFNKQCCDADCVQNCVDSDIRAITGWNMFTDPISIERFAEDHGLAAEIYINGDLERIRWFVEQGIPVMLDIIAVPGSTNIDRGHWVVVTGFCELPPTMETYVQIYCPHAQEVAMLPERLAQYWGKIEWEGQDLWDGLFIAISEQRLPDGNTDEIAARLAVAKGITDWVMSLENFKNGEVLEGTVRFCTGAAVALGSFVSHYLFDWTGDHIPVIGGFLSATGEYAGDLFLIIDDLGNKLADMLKWENLRPDLFLQNLGELFLDTMEALVSILAETFEFIYEFFVDGIGGFVKDVWNGLKSASCALGIGGCPKTVTFYKHYVSSDPCLEWTYFVNGLSRVEALGYIHQYPAPGTKPIWLYMSTDPPSTRDYHLADTSDLATANRVNLGIAGYTLTTASSSTDLDLDQDLTTRASAQNSIFNIAVTGDLGFLPNEPAPGATILWLMQSMDNPAAFTVSADPCAFTRTFITPIVQDYTQEVVVGLLPKSETEGAVKLFRFWDADTEDCMLATDSTMQENYVNHGYLGYIYTEPGSGRIPLWQYTNAKRKDHLISIYPDGAEGLSTYSEWPELLGYVLSPSLSTDMGDSTCYTPLWRFCKRTTKKE